MARIYVTLIRKACSKLSSRINLQPKKVVFVVGAVLAVAALSWGAFERTSPHVGIQMANSNPYVKEYSLPDEPGPNGLTVDSHGTVWVASSKSDLLYSLDINSGKLDSFEIKDGGFHYFNPGENATMVWTMVRGGGDSLWFSPLGANSIWHFFKANGTFQAIPSNTGSAFQMKLDENSGDVWFTTLSRNSLCVLEKDPNTQEGYKITSYDLGNETGPAGLFLYGNSVWVTEITAQRIVEYEINHQDGLVSGITKTREFPLGNGTQLSSPTDLVLDNGSIWLTEHGTSFLTRYVLSSNTVVRYPTSQNLFHAATLPFWIREAGGGKYLWFNEHEGNKLAVFNTVNKTMVEYDIPSRPKDGYLTYPLNIATDPSDDMILWFSEWNTDKLGRIDGHVEIPFSLSSDASKIVLSQDASKVVTVNLKVEGKSPLSGNIVYLNASSSIDPAAGFGNTDISIEPSTVDLSSVHDAHLTIRNYSAPPGNYTLGVSASNGVVTKTIFLDLMVPSG